MCAEYNPLRPVMCHARWPSFAVTGLFSGPSVSRKAFVDVQLAPMATGVAVKAAPFAEVRRYTGCDPSRCVPHIVVTLASMFVGGDGALLTLGCLPGTLLPVQGVERLAYRCTEMRPAGRDAAGGCVEVIGFPLVAKESRFEENHRSKHFHERMARVQVSASYTLLYPGTWKLPPTP